MSVLAQGVTGVTGIIVYHLTLLGVSCEGGGGVERPVLLLSLLWPVLIVGEGLWSLWKKTQA